MHSEAEDVPQQVRKKELMSVPYYKKIYASHVFTPTKLHSEHGGPSMVLLFTCGEYRNHFCPVFETLLWIVGLPMEKRRILTIAHMKPCGVV